MLIGITDICPKWYFEILALSHLYAMLFNSGDVSMVSEIFLDKSKKTLKIRVIYTFPMAKSP